MENRTLKPVERAKNTNPVFFSSGFLQLLSLNRLDLKIIGCLRSSLMVDSLMSGIYARSFC